MRYIVWTYWNCQRCPLHQHRKTIVFGRGQIPADVLFVGEAPCKSENLRGVPFIGPSGKLLDMAIVQAACLVDLEAPPRFFVTNVAACRPCDSPLGDNRPPTGEESWACWPRLERTYMDAKPKAVVLLGKVAAQYCKKAWPNATELYHPAYILRLGGQESTAYREFVRNLGEVFRRIA